MPLKLSGFFISSPVAVAAGRVHFPHAFPRLQSSPTAAPSLHTPGAHSQMDTEKYIDLFVSLSSLAGCLEALGVVSSQVYSLRVVHLY